MSERTEAPSPRRRAELRRKGQIARSMELAPSLSLLAITLMLGSYGVTLVAELADVMRRSFRSELTMHDWTVTAVYQGGLDLMLMLTRLLAPLLLVALAVGLAVNLGQTRFLFTPYPLVPNLSRLNPIQGLTRLFSHRGLVELARSLAKMLIIGFVAYRTLAGKAGVLAATVDMEPTAAAAMLARVGAAMALRVAVLLALLAGLDYIYQRRQFELDIRMTKRELLEELRNIEGHPLIKGRRKQAQRRLALQRMMQAVRAQVARHGGGAQRRLALQRMMQAVPTADVVVTNPIHLAVAVEYKAEKMEAPTVVAKGQRLIAERIVKLAREHNVPVVQNVPLAHALFTMAEVGEQIPQGLYQTMAEVLAFVYQLRAGRER